MKYLSTIFLGVFVFMQSCSPSACDCSEILNAWIVLNPNAEYTVEESGECVRKFNTSSQEWGDKAHASAKRNARAECSK